MKECWHCGGAEETHNARTTGTGACHGVFGYGIGDLAEAVGADVETVGFGYDETLHDWDRIEAAIARHRPVMITAKSIVKPHPER